ncbi:hypothetical protein G6F22_021721 [Rhizopus arrhizus]|nr:hypothetical protein G6F22_021721 [Rhizopus arrhizus]
MGHPKRRRPASRPGPRHPDADQRHHRAAAGRGERRAGLKTGVRQRHARRSRCGDQWPIRRSPPAIGSAVPPCRESGQRPRGGTRKSAPRPGLRPPCPAWCSDHC